MEAIYFQTWPDARWMSPVTPVMTHWAKESLSQVQHNFLNHENMRYNEIVLAFFKLCLEGKE